MDIIDTIPPTIVTVFSLEIQVISQQDLINMGLNTNIGKVSNSGILYWTFQQQLFFLSWNIIQMLYQL
jgi:hypothetical protein